MKKIPLTQGRFTIIDDEDFEEVNKYKWYVSNEYVARMLLPANRRVQISLHRILMNPPPNLQVDHINGDTLDNRRKNLRVVTLRENVINQKLHKNNTSGYKGVSWDKKLEKWETSINPNGKKIRVGFFNSLLEAVEAYNKSAIKYFGEYARLNTTERL